VKYVDAKNASKTCPPCSGYLVAYGGRLMKCERCSLTMDRDMVAALNIQMRGAGLPPKSPQEGRAKQRQRNTTHLYLAQNPVVPNTLGLEIC